MALRFTQQTQARLVASFRKTVSATACAAVASILACSGSTVGTAGSQPISITELPTQFADEICDRLGPCCHAVSFAYEGGSCRGTLAATFSESLSKIDPAHAAYDPNAARRCLDAFDGVVQECGSFDSPAIQAACALVFVGKLSPGAACNSDDECAQPAEGSAYCDLGATGRCVVQAGPPHGKAGEPCMGDCFVTGDDSACSGIAPSAGGSATALCFHGDGLHCAASATVPVCKPIAAIGEACTDSGGCAEGTFCNAGICAATYDSGPCGTAYDACSSQSYCDDSTGLCTAKSADGAACPSNITCASGSCNFPGGVPPQSQPAGGGGVATLGTCGAAHPISEAMCRGNLGG